MDSFNGRPKFDLDMNFFSNLLEPCNKKAEKKFFYREVERMLPEFECLKTDEERISFAWQFVKQTVTFNDYGVNGSKSHKNSEELRLNGNKYYKAKNYEEALTCYSKAVAAAPYPTSLNGATNDNAEVASEAETLLSFALANRSAVLFDLRKYDSCLKDISFALCVKYPEDLQYKLYIRRVKCYQALGKVNEMKDTLQVAMDSLAVTKILNESNRKTLISELKAIYKSARSLTRNSKKGNVLHTKKEEPKLSSGANPNLPACSDCVELKVTEDMGRGVFATRDIQLGDIILVEKPYSSTLRQRYYFSYCHHCQKKCNALIPCLNCSVVMFCDEDCRKQSWDNYHSVECDLLPFFMYNSVGSEALLGIRTIFIAARTFKSLADFYETVTKFDKNPPGPDATVAIKEYYKVYKLLTNTEHLSAEKLLLHCYQAVFVVTIVDRKTNYFRTRNVWNICNGRVPISKLKNFIARLTLKHLLNQHGEVRSSLCGKNGMVGDSLTVGDAIYPTLNLFNHSCVPNVFHYTPVDNRMVLRALRNIKKGEQILYSYGPIYHKHGLLDRRSYLSSVYFFTCRCVACMKNWPKMDILKEKCRMKCKSCHVILPAISSKSSTAICPNCNQLNNIEKVAIKMYNQVEDVINKYSRGVLQINDVVKGLKYLDDNVCKPSYDHEMFMKYLRNCFLRTHCPVDC